MINFRIIPEDVGLEPQTNTAAKLLRDKTIPFMQKGNVFRIHDQNSETVCKLFGSDMTIAYEMYTDEEASSGY